MKQKRFGKKVQNWHRPLRVDEKNHRYLRNRYLDPEWTEKGESRGATYEYFGYPSDELDYDDFWNKYDPNDPYLHIIADKHFVLDSWRDHVQGFIDSNAERSAVRHFKNWIDDFAKPTELEIKLREYYPEDIENDYSNLKVVPPSYDSIHEELRLFKEIHYIFDDSIQNIWDKVRQAVGHPQNARMIHTYYSGENHHQVRHWLILFSPFWVRLPVHWDPDGEVSLIEHLFCTYKTPHFLLSEWERAQGGMREKWLLWLILLGQGGSLHQAADLFHWKIPKKFSHFLYEAPENASPLLACIYAKILGMGGNLWIYENLIRQDFFLIDPTRYEFPEEYPFWTETVQWLILHHHEMNHEQCQLILSWGVHEHIEWRYPSSRFSWKGRNVTQSLRRAEAYQESLNQLKAISSWEHRGWDWETTTSAGETWKIQELTSGEELIWEGRSMRHCVGTYQTLCKAGHSTIFSMTRDGKRRVTIELDPNILYLKQIRGKGNRMAQPQERELALVWVEYIRGLLLTKEAQH